jgi:hypothetical protein
MIRKKIWCGDEVRSIRIIRGKKSELPRFRRKLEKITQNAFGRVGVKCLGKVCWGKEKRHLQNVVSA